MARRRFRKVKTEEQWWVGLTTSEVFEVLRTDFRRTFRIHTVIQIVAIAAMLTAAKIL